MTVLSRNLIRGLIIQEMRLRAPGRPLRRKLDLLFGDDDKTLDIDDTTDIDDVPSFMSGFEDTEVDFDSDLDDFGFEIDDDDDDFEFESETEEDPDLESETEYNPGRQVMGMSREEIRKHVMSAAEKLAPDMSGRSERSRAERQYDDLVRQGREAEMPDPEFMGTEDLDIENTLELPQYNQRKKLREHISKKIRQSIRRQMI